MRSILSVILLAFCFTLSACKDSKPQAEYGKLYLVCTTGMVGDALANIAGDLAEVEALMGAGVDPHLYKASPGDLAKLKRADAIFYNGLHLEGKMAQALEKLGERKPTVAIAEGLPKDRLIRVGGETFDPHVWFDVSLWRGAVAHANLRLQAIDPANAAAYQANADRYLAQLDNLHEEVKAALADIPAKRRTLVTSHDAFAYFGRAYEVQVAAPQGISTVLEPSLSAVSELVDTIVEQKIAAVFVETSVSEKVLRTVTESCRAKGYEVRIGGSLYSDAMGEAGSPEGTYVGMVRANVRTIVEGLKE